MASEPHAPAPPSATPTFELRRFAWSTPDRLEVSGTFGGLQQPAAGPPVLVIHAADRVLRLAAVADSVDGPPEEGLVWQAVFAWQDAPVAFDGAELHLGAGLVVNLPEPGAKRRLTRPRLLEVHTATVSGPQTSHEATPAKLSADGAAPSVGSQVELLAAQEEVREVRVEMLQTQEELTRARDDLRAERERRTGDGERFREALANLRASAEEALTVEQSAKEQLGGDLREAHEAILEKDAALEALRKELDAAGAALTRAESKAQADTDSLRKQVAQLETDGKETQRTRAELDRTRARADAAHTELEKARGAVDQARDDAERLLARLTAIRAT